jgi:DNA-binding transcriptional LysR family regulator
MDLNSAFIFVRVAQLGSFTKAARALRLPNSSVSDRISDLEKSLGVRLLVRTTRKLHLTDAGSKFLQKAELAVTALTEAGEEASSSQNQPTGILRITAPVEFDLSSISAAVTEYLRKFPQVRMQFLLTERVVDLIGEGFDIAIRVGQAKPSSLSTVGLGTTGFVLVASPDYISRWPKISHPRDLTDHNCLSVSTEKERDQHCHLGLDLRGRPKGQDRDPGPHLLQLSQRNQASRFGRRRRCPHARNRRVR